MIGGQYRPLKDEDVGRIHEASLTVLERTGIEVVESEGFSESRRSIRTRRMRTRSRTASLSNSCKAYPPRSVGALPGSATPSRIPVSAS